MAQQHIRPSTTYLTTAMRKVRLQPNMHGFAPASVSRMFCCSPGTAAPPFQAVHAAKHGLQRIAPAVVALWLAKGLLFDESAEHASTAELTAPNCMM
jgi:hypothetical protein